MYAAASVVDGSNVTRFVCGSRVALASAAAAAASVGPTKLPCAFWMAAVGMFHGVPSGAPTHTPGSGKASWSEVPSDPRPSHAVRLIGALVSALMDSSLPMSPASPPTKACWVWNGQTSDGVSVPWLALLAGLAGALSNSARATGSLSM